MLSRSRFYWYQCRVLMTLVPIRNLLGHWYCAYHIYFEVSVSIPDLHNMQIIGRNLWRGLKDLKIYTINYYSTLTGCWTMFLRNTMFLKKKCPPPRRHEAKVSPPTAGCGARCGGDTRCGGGTQGP